jgi:hypothetical protein
MQNLDQERLSDPKFLAIMFIGFICIPLALILVKKYLFPSLSLLLIVFSVIILPSGILFMLNGIRLKKEVIYLELKIFFSRLWKHKYYTKKTVETFIELTNIGKIYADSIDHLSEEEKAYWKRFKKIDFKE